jgi:hypothetical protein
MIKNPIDVTGQKREEEKPKVVAVKGQYDFRYENSINGKDYIDLDRPLEHKYSQWRTNGIFSNYQDTIVAANEMNRAHHLTDRLHYDFLFFDIRAKKRWTKGLSKEDKDRIKKEQELHTLIQDFYKYNNARTREALRILTPKQIKMIREKQEKGGVK